MSAASALLARRVPSVPPAQWGLRGAVVVATVVLVAVAALAGDVGSLMPVGLVLLAVVVALRPDSHAGLVLVAGLVWLWATSVPESLSAWTLLAALDLVVLHVACTVAALGPPRLVPGRAVVRLWGTRAVLLWAAAALVWLVSVGASRLDPTASAWATVAAFAVLLAWFAVLSRRTLTREDGPIS